MVNALFLNVAISSGLSIDEEREQKHPMEAASGGVITDWNVSS